MTESVQRGGMPSGSANKARRGMRITARWCPSWRLSRWVTKRDLDDGSGRSARRVSDCGPTSTRPSSSRPAPGTGKTTALVGRIVELIAAGKLDMDRLGRLRLQTDRGRVARPNSAGASAPSASEMGPTEKGVGWLHGGSTSRRSRRSTPLPAACCGRFRWKPTCHQASARSTRFNRSGRLGRRFAHGFTTRYPKAEFADRPAGGAAGAGTEHVAEQLRGLATRLQDYRDLLNPETEWPRPDLRDPLDAAHRCAAQLLDLCGAAGEALDPEDRLVYELRRLHPLAERLANVDGADGRCACWDSAIPNSRAQQATGRAGDAR